MDKPRNHGKILKAAECTTSEPPGQTPLLLIGLVAKGSRESDRREKDFHQMTGQESLGPQSRVIYLDGTLIQDSLFSSGLINGAFLFLASPPLRWLCPLKNTGTLFCFVC